jgi:DNA segregation ATPase FtsK/SpoIIIE-like protein
MADPDRAIRIAVMGATGSGKSTFINKASGSNLLVGRSLESCTREVQTSLPFVVSGRIVTLIDTPGFDDTDRSDTAILNMIAAYLSKTYERGTKLAGVIYMHRISDCRMNGTSKRNFKIFRELCGERSLKNVIILTNMWSGVTREIGEAREAELARMDKFFKPALDKGAQLLRHDGTLESAHTTLRYLINNQPVPLRIQQEIVDEHRSIETTAAGTELRSALDEQADQHREEIRNLKAEMEAAIRAKDEETRRELQEELEKKQKECLRIEQNSQRMAVEFAAERARLEALILQMEAEQQKQLQAFKSLQGEVAKVLTEKEEQEILHAQRNSSILAAKQAEEKRRIRELEEERNARVLAEESHHKHLQSLLDDMEETRIAKEIADIAHADEVKRERDRLAALEAEQQRQKSTMEIAERERAQEEAERVRLKEELAQRDKELEETQLRLVELQNEGQSSLERSRLPQSSIQTPKLPFVVWKVATAWWGTTR